MVASVTQVSDEWHKIEVVNKNTTSAVLFTYIGYESAM